MKAYLSGGMEYASEHGAGWRVEFEEWLNQYLGHNSFNPVKESERFIHKHYPGLNISSAKVHDPETFRRFAAEIVKIDSNEIAYKSDYVICYWDESAQRGAGTKGEVTLARFFGKPVYVVSSQSFDTIPGWVVGCATQIFRTFEELKQHLLTVYRDGEIVKEMNRKSNEKT